MQGPLSTDLLRTYAKFSADGLPVDKNTRNLLRLRLEDAEPRQRGGRFASAGNLSRLRSLIAEFWTLMARQQHTGI